MALYEAAAPAVLAILQKTTEVHTRLEAARLQARATAEVRSTHHFMHARIWVFFRLSLSYYLRYGAKASTILEQGLSRSSSRVFNQKDVRMEDLPWHLVPISPRMYRKVSLQPS